jgi:hypothetical protein
MNGPAKREKRGRGSRALEKGLDEKEYRTVLDRMVRWLKSLGRDGWRE